MVPIMQITVALVKALASTMVAAEHYNSHTSACLEQLAKASRASKISQEYSQTPKEYASTPTGTACNQFSIQVLLSVATHNYAASDKANVLRIASACQVCSVQLLGTRIFRALSLMAHCP